MPVIDVQNIKGDQISQLELADDVFNVPVKPSVLHQVVTMQLSNRRSSTAAVKHRSEIRGSGRKLFRQKGTGRARRGDIKSPLLRGGGVVFGPDKRKYAHQVPKKVKKLALKMALSSKLFENELVVVDHFELDEIKTKKVVKILETLNLNSALIVTENKDINLELSSRNISDVKVIRAEGLNVYDILKYRKLVLLEPTVKSIEGRLLA